MDFSDILHSLILLHAVLGSVALLSGLLAIFTKKGSKTHISSGRIFYYSMGMSIIVSLFVAAMPEHFNPFLFSIGLFSLYFIIIGKRAIQYKNNLTSFTTDISIHVMMAGICLSMMALPVIFTASFHKVAGPFGLIGLFFAYRNLNALKYPDNIRRDWLKIHISHISGGYISAVTAFFVVNGFLPGVFNWFVPGIIGTCFIFYSIRKIDNSKKIKANFLQTQKAVIAIIFCTIGFTETSFCQSDASNIPHGKEIGLRFGISRSNVRDQRLSATSFINWSPKYGIVFGTKKENSWSQNIIDFTYVKGNKKDPYFTINSIIISCTYSYQRKVGEALWMGGFTKHHTVLNFPESLYASIFTNNAISYTIAQSIGPKISYANSPLSPNEKTTFGFTSFQTPIMSYLIQPIYGHPYPEKYLKEGTFQPTRAGMTWPMIASGKLVSFSKYSSFQLEIGVFYYISDRFKIGATYEGEMMYANANSKSVKLQTNDIVISPGYLY